AQPAALRTSLPAGGAATSLSGGGARFGMVWPATAGSSGISPQGAILRVFLQARTDALTGTVAAAASTLTWRAPAGGPVLTGAPAYLSKTASGGGHDQVITFRAGGPAFTRRRYRRMRDEQAARDAALQAAAEQAEATARATAAAAAAHAAELRRRRWQAE